MQFARAYYTVMVDLTQIAFFGLRLKIAFLNEVSHIAVTWRNHATVVAPAPWSVH